MNKIKLALKLVNTKSQGERVLINLADDPNPNIVLEKQLDQLVESLNVSKAISEDPHPYEKFLAQLRKSHKWQNAIKLLYASHYLMDRIGQPFCVAFARERLSNIDKLPKDKHGTEYFYDVITTNYYSMLNCYANCFNIIQKMTRISIESIVESITSNEMTYLSNLLEIKDFIKLITMTHVGIKESLENAKYRPIFEKIATRLIKDIIPAYNVLTEVLDNSKEKIFVLDRRTALMLDELYSETIQITKKLKVFLEELPLKEKTYLNQVDFFEFDPEFNKREELFMLDMKNLDKDTPRIRALHTQEDEDYSHKKEVELKSRKGNRPLGVKDINAPQVHVKASTNTKGSRHAHKSSEAYRMLSPEVSNDENSSLRAQLKSPSGDSLSSEELFFGGDNQESNIQSSVLPREDIDLLGTQQDLLSSNLLSMEK